MSDKFDINDPYDFGDDNFEKVTKRVIISPTYRDEIKSLENACALPDFLDHVFIIPVLMSVMHDMGKTYNVSDLDNSRGAQLTVSARAFEFIESINVFGCKWSNFNMIYRGCAQFIIDIKKIGEYDKLVRVIRGRYNGHQE